MIFSIIPDFANLERTIAVSEEYECVWEYNDFCYPAVYDNASEIDNRIRIYTSLERNRANDTMHGAFLGLDIAAIDPVLRERSRSLCEQSLQIAKRLGLKGVVFHTGLIGELRLEYYLENWLGEAKIFWSEMCAKYPEIIVYMENSFEQDPDIFVRLMEQMKDVTNFRLCFDYGHAILTHTPVKKWVCTLAPFIGHVHLNDNDLVDDLHLIPGDGKIDFHEWKKLMADNGIDTSVLLEINGIDRVQRALEYMRTL